MDSRSEPLLLPPADRRRGPALLDVFASMALSTPVGAVDVRRLARSLATAGGDVRLLGALLGADGRRLLWHFRARDHREVGRRLGRAGIPPVRTWLGNIREPNPAQPANVAVEHETDPAGPVPALVGLPGGPGVEDRQTLCLVTHRVTPVRAARSLDGRHLLVLYHAPDSESVRQAQRNSSVPGGAVWPFLLIPPA